MANPKCIFEFPGKHSRSFPITDVNDDLKFADENLIRSTRNIKESLSPDVLQKIDDVILKSSRNASNRNMGINTEKLLKKGTTEQDVVCDTLERTSPLGTKVSVNFKISLLDPDSTNGQNTGLTNDNPVLTGPDIIPSSHVVHFDLPSDVSEFGPKTMFSNQMCSSVKDMRGNCASNQYTPCKKHRAGVVLDPKYLKANKVPPRSLHSNRIGIDNHAFDHEQETENEERYHVVNGMLSQCNPYSGDTHQTVLHKDERDLVFRTLSPKDPIDLLRETSPRLSKKSKSCSQCVVIFGAFWVCFFSLGIPFSIGTFLPAWLEEFKDGRARTAMIQSVLVGILFGVGTIVGFLIDRFGIRIIVCLGSVLSCVGFIGAVFAPNTITLVITIGIISGTGLCGVYLGSVVAVSAICSKSASIALGIIIAGGGLGQSVLPYFNDYLQTVYGWRGAFYVIAGMSLQPLVFGVLMTSFVEKAKSKRHKKAAEVSFRDKMSTICTLRFILTCLATCIGFASTNGFFFIILDFAQISHGEGVFFIFLITTVSTVCNIGFGLINMLPFVSSSVLLSMSVMISGATLVLLSFVTDYIHTVIIIVVFGIVYGGKIGISGVVVLDLVGRDAYSLAMGITITVNGIASSLGGVMFGLLFDLTHSYDTPLVVMGSVACVVGSFPIIGLLISKRCGDGKNKKPV